MTEIRADFDANEPNLEASFDLTRPHYEATFDIDQSQIDVTMELSQSQMSADFELDEQEINAIFELNVAGDGKKKLSELEDVTITSPTQGQNLTYDSTLQKWKNTSSSATVGWGGITGTLSDQTDLQNALDNKVTKNNDIIAGIHTKITYDNKGLITAGNDLELSDLPTINLENLGDIIITSPTQGQNLTYDATNNTWKNTNITAATWGNITGNIQSQTDLQEEFNVKQDVLESGTNIKTINNTSIVGPGNITITAETFVHEQGITSDVWVINHNLNKFPSVTIIDSAGSNVECDVTYDNTNTCTLRMNGAFKGTAYLN